MANILLRIRELLKRKAVQKKIKKGVSIVSCVVVFSTTYALLLPALTLESTAVCGMEEHQHSEECYEEVLVCGMEESDGHQHTEACYDEAGELICGQEESEGHHHDSSCYETRLICGLENHIHTEECYKNSEQDPEETTASETEEQPQEEQEIQEQVVQETNDAAPVNNVAEIAAPSHKSAIKFAEFLSDYTGILYHPEGAGSDEWEPADSALRDRMDLDPEMIALDPEEQVIVHIAYRLPAGTVNATNAETEYELPLLLEMTSEEVRENNKYQYQIFEGTDREADSLKEAGTYEIQEKRNGKGEITERKIVIRWNADTCRRCDGEKLTDGTVTVQPSEVEGFFELLISADELLALEDDAGDENARVLYWDKKNGDFSTVVLFDTEALKEEEPTEEVPAQEAENAEGNVNTEPTETVEAAPEVTTEIEEQTETQPETTEPEVEVITEPVYAAGTLIYDGGSYTAEVTFDQSAQLPEGTVFTAKEVKGTAAARYGKKAAAALEGKEINSAAFYALHFEDADGNTVVPAEGSELAVRIQYRNAEMIAEGTQMEGICLAHSTVEPFAVQVSGVADGSVDIVSFTVSGSDVYGILNTKEVPLFNKGVRYTYNIERDKEVSLPEIFDALRIMDEETGTLLKSEDVQQVESSNEALLSVTHKTKFLGLFGKEEWLVKGLQPFTSEEMLTVTLKDGRILKIAVSEIDFVSYVMTADGEKYKVSVSYDAESGIPSDASLSVREIAEDTEEYAAYMREVEAAMAAGRKVQTAKLFDITILDGKGNEIEPFTPVRVNIEFVPEEVAEGTNIELYHFQTEGETPQVMENVEVHTDEANTVNGIEFETDGFSVYGVVYTVDFENTVDDETYRFSLTGGGFVSFTDLVERLGIVDDTNTARATGDYEVSEAAKNFVADVVSIEFSSPSLVDVSKVETETTVGQIKESRGLECEYSAELTEEQISEINGTVVEAGDWALISMQPFDTEETLTVTMKDGEVLTIRVTDAQLRKTVIDAKGDTWEVTVTYTDDAQIPEGAELEVQEITEEAEHEAYVTKTQEAIGRETDGSNARFFDISIIDKDGNEVQPKAAVSVEIRLLDTEIAENTQVVHFGETAELMDLQRDTDTLNFQTEGFSVFAVVVVESEEGAYVFRGEGFTVTVTHTAEAQIPLGTILTVEELDPESNEYIQRLGQAWYEVNREYFEVEEMRANYNEGMEDLPELPLINLDHARFFNIDLVYEGEEIKPVVPVQVEIAYDDGITIAGEAVSGVVRYTGDEVELIDQVNTVTEGNSVLAFKYEQAGITDTGTFVGQKTYDEVAEHEVLPAPEPMQYPMLQKKAAGTKELMAAGNSETEEGEKGENKGEEADLTAPIATKTLTPNKAGETNDGTYTLELAVDGRAKSSTTTEIKKSNVLIVMDRSSSMINNIATNDVTQVATYWNGNYYSNGVIWRPTEGVTYYGYIYSNGENRYRELFYNNGQFYYYDSQGVTTATTTSYTGNIYTSKTRTRLDEEQEALNKLIYDLLAKNGEGTTDEGVSLEDIIEISVISFAKDRMDQNDGTPHPSSEQDWTTSYSDLINAVNDPYAPSGTNWEQALRYAMEEITAKKQDPTQAGEDYYLVFLTDGEPTATKAHHSGAYYYEGSHGGFDNAYNPARNYIRDESGIAAAEDIHFYGIMTWATNETMRGYLKRLVNVGNGNVSNETDFTTEAVDEDGVDDYYYDADSLEKLEDAFANIFNIISNNVAYEQVSISDGLTTDAMTTTLVNGSAKGFQYTVYKNRIVDANGKIVSKGTPVYTVTATDGEGGEPNVTFHIGENEYTGNDVQKKAYEYDELQDDGTTLVRKTKYYYSVTVGEGANAHEYKMTLAEKTGDRLNWDLAAIGALEDGYTYAVSFTVWPDQDAYDYVAALNNGLEHITDSNGNMVDVNWDSSVETDANKVTDSNGKSYWKGGALPDYPSIIKYTDGTYAVLTNTDQSLKYTIAKTETVNGVPTVVYEGPYTPDLPSPDPMPLTGTASQLEKVWNINRDPSILYKYLYESKDGDGKPVAFDIGFEIDQDGEEYKQVHLPGKATVTADGVTYDWSAYKDEDLVTYNGKTFSKRWSQDFSISTGLMLSEAQMDARSLDKSLYTDNYLVGNTRYYVLEPGHDFKICEPALGYEFDFEEPTYHPMLVDGVLMDVKFTTEGGTKRISSMEALEIDNATGNSALTVFNTLRGYINVKKNVVGSDGTTALTTDDTEFTFEVELTNAMPVFEGNHIPWYGINGLYYHDVDKDDDYYQAEYVNGVLQVTTEEGGPYTGVGTAFNPDNAGAQIITYLVDGQERSVTICGNQMTPDEGDDENGYKKVTAIAKITQAETLYIANVPVNTHYTIKETGVAELGYQLFDIDREVGIEGSAPGGNIDIDNGNITGEIVQNTETLITYTNKCLVTDITIQKTDPEGNGLEGAVFRLVRLEDGGAGVAPESDASLIESVSGLITITKTVNGETKTYSSAFESDGNVQTIHGLPDGTYRLYEVYVPDGFINTYRYIQFDIEDRVMKNVTTDTGDTSKLDTTENNIDLKIVNTPGVALPAAGGPGTQIFMIFGSILILGAGILLLRSRKFS